MTRYRWVDSRRAEGFLVTLACAVAGVSTSAFYAWLHAMRHAPTPAQMEQAYLINAIIDVHRDSDGAYGVPRVARQLRHDGWPVNHKRVERLMRANGIVGVHKRRGVRTTIPAQDNPPIPDLIGRGFAPGRQDLAWCGDITYIRTGEGWLCRPVVVRGCVVDRRRWSTGVRWSRSQWWAARRQFGKVQVWSRAMMWSVRSFGGR